MNPTLEIKVENAFKALLDESPILKATGTLPNDSEQEKDVRIVISAKKGTETVPMSNNWNVEVTITAKSRIKRDGQGPERLDLIASEIERVLSGTQLVSPTLWERLTQTTAGLMVRWGTPGNIDRTPQDMANKRQLLWNIVAYNI